MSFLKEMFPGAFGDTEGVSVNETTTNQKDKIVEEFVDKMIKKFRQPIVNKTLEMVKDVSVEELQKTLKTLETELDNLDLDESLASIFNEETKTNNVDNSIEKAFSIEEVIENLTKASVTA